MMRSLSGLLGALAAPSAPVHILAPRPETWRVAAYLATAVRGTPGARAINAAGREFTFALAPCPVATADEARARAIALRGAASGLPAEDRAPVVLALLRLLLDDAPTDAAVAFDRAIVAAGAAEGVTPTAAQRALAAGIFAEVLR